MLQVNLVKKIVHVVLDKDRKGSWDGRKIGSHGENIDIVGA
jgi:hypothetical protein